MSWYKVHDLAHSDPKFETVAELALAEPHLASQTFFMACDHANQHGGSLERFDLRPVARFARRPLEEVLRVWQVLIDEGMILIDAMVDRVKVAAGELRSWAARQGLAERAQAAAKASPGALRTRRWRTRREASQAAPGGVTDAVTCDVTPLREEQSRGERAPPGVPPVTAGGDALPLIRIGSSEKGAARAGTPPAEGSTAAPPGMPPGSYQTDLLLPIAGGRRRAEPRSGRRKSPHKARADIWGRVGAAMVDPLAVPGGFAGAAGF